jgi:hypothetical protein
MLPGLFDRVDTTFRWGSRRGQATFEATEAQAIFTTRFNLQRTKTS